MAPTTYDVWGFPVEVTQATNFPAGWLETASSAELAALNIVDLADPETRAGYDIVSQHLAIDENGAPKWIVAYVPTPTPPPVTMTVSRMQAKLALDAAGLLEDVEAAVAAAPRATQIYWAEVSELHRDHPVLRAVTAGLGMIETEVDDLFRAAAAIA